MGEVRAALCRTSPKSCRDLPPIDNAKSLQGLSNHGLRGAKAPSIRMNPPESTRFLDYRPVCLDMPVLWLSSCPKSVEDPCAWSCPREEDPHPTNQVSDISRGRSTRQRPENVRRVRCRSTGCPLFHPGLHPRRGCLEHNALHCPEARDSCEDEASLQ
jgi:hypothetical protein